MTPQARLGLATTVLSFIGGVWLFLAPFIVEYQEVGEDWIRATRNDLWTGGILMAISALALFIFVAFALRDAAARADKRRHMEEDSQRGDSQGRQE
jgi:cytochrome c oxidase assembly factor CtaG